MTAGTDDVGARALGDNVVNATVYLALLVLDDQGHSTFGACEFETVLVPDELGRMMPGELGPLQHQGVARLEVRDGMTDNGRFRPILTIPAQVQNTRAQVAVSVFSAPGTSLGEILMNLCLEPADGGEQLGVEFQLDPNTQSTITAIPPLIDWKYLRAYNHTEDFGDAEFFDPQAVPVLNLNSWADVPILTWDDLPDNLAWAEADALWAS